MNGTQQDSVAVLRNLLAEAKCGELLLETNEYEALNVAITALQSQQGASADRGEAVEWPCEAKRAPSGGGWRALTRNVEHRMDESQAMVWNSCRNACIAAAALATSPSPAESAERKCYCPACKEIRSAAPSGVSDAVAWFTDDHLSDRSATTYDKVVAERWRAKGWPVTPLFATPPSSAAELLDFQAEIDACTQDAVMSGTGVMLDGRRIDPERLRIYTAKQTAAPSGVSDADVERALRAFHGDGGNFHHIQWTTDQRRSMRAALEAAQPQPGRVEGMVLDAYQLRCAAEFAAPDYEKDEAQRGTELVFQQMPERMVDGEALPAGMVCWYAEYPEEGYAALETYEDYTKRMAATDSSQEPDHG